MRASEPHDGMEGPKKPQAGAHPPTRVNTLGGTNPRRYLSIIQGHLHASSSAAVPGIVPATATSATSTPEESVVTALVYNKAFRNTSCMLELTAKRAWRACLRSSGQCFWQRLCLWPHRGLPHRCTHRRFGGRQNCLVCKDAKLRVLHCRLASSRKDFR